MTSGTPLRWLENRYLSWMLRGRGLEIGALWRRFPVHHSSTVLYMDRAEVDDLKGQYADVGQQIFRPDLIGDAADFPIACGKLDFLIASHVMEHLPFPLAALRAWYEALAPGGKLLLKVPDKRYTFDRQRERTTLAHLTAEYEHPETTNWSEHYCEWVEKVDRRKPTEQEIVNGAAGLKSGAFNIHFHAWTGNDIMEIIRFTQQAWHFDWKPRLFWDAGIFRKEITVLVVRSGTQLLVP